MAHKSTFETKFRRRRQGKTNYKRRLELVKSTVPRFVVRKSNRYVRCQLVEFDLNGDRTVAEANSRQLKQFGWSLSCKNLPSAYLTGLLCGLRAKKNGVEKAILDIGFSAATHGSIPFAALKGAVDSGLEVKHDAKALPDNERLQGKHIEEYKKNNAQAVFNEVKQKVIEKFKGSEEVKADGKS